MNLRAMNMLYESIVKRGSLMVVPSGLADSLNLPGIMGMMGASGRVPHGDVVEGDVLGVEALVGSADDRTKQAARAAVAPDGHSDAVVSRQDGEVRS
jgi:hypothetical protein